MSGRGDKEDADRALARLEELIEALETHPGPAGATARELVALVLELHGLGLARLMAILAPAQGVAPVVERLVQDEHVRAMLLLHGLHPEDLETRVRRAVERLRPHLGVHGLRLDLEDVSKGVVRLRLCGLEPRTPSPLSWSLPAEIEQAIFEAAPDTEKVLIEGLDFPSAASSSRAAE